MVITHLILNDMLKLKSELSDLALLLGLSQYPVLTPHHQK